MILLQFVAEHSNASSGFTDDEKIAKCCGTYYLASNMLFSDYQRFARKSHITGAFRMRDQVVEEPWLLQPSLVSHNFADVYNSSSDIDNEGKILKSSDPSDVQNSDFNHKSNDEVNERKVLLTNDPVEEPWLFESICSRFKEASGVASEQHQPTPENPLHEEENTVMTKEESVSTVILINSSICTVQRIAVLENNKLVELLLEPVKTNVLCDNVYLGVVTKLVPHMGGAFVNIGSPRPSFMDIRPYKAPFVFPSFNGPMEEKEINGSTSNRLVEQLDFPENGALPARVEEPEEEEYDESEDEFINDEIEHQGNQINCDVLDVIKENLNGSIAGHGVEGDKLQSLERLSGEADQVQTRSQTHDASVKVKKNKWEQVKKGSMIIVQVVKEGLGTKGPTLTAYPKLRSRFWVCNIW